MTDTTTNTLTAEPGNPNALGAHLVKEGKKGVNFAVYTGSEVTNAWVCLFDKDGKEIRYKLHPKKDTGHFLDGVSICEGQIWSGFIAGIDEGQAYGYRVDGPYRLHEAGARVSKNPSDLSAACAYHPNRLLTDPYAYGSEKNGFDWQQANAGSLFNCDPIPPARKRSEKLTKEQKEEIYRRTLKKPNQIQDTAACVPKSVVVDIDRIREEYHCKKEKPLHRFSDAIISEVHVSEATKRFEGIPEAFKGTYKGLCQPEFIDQLKKMGKTVLELMPVHRGRTHWGYETENFFDVDPRYAAKFEADGKTPCKQTPLEQFTEMVQTLRKAGIDVWMDVVYNHTAEGSHLGPTTSFKGFDWRYYRHHGPEHGFTPEHFWDSTGTGNTFNTDHPRARELILNSLAFFHSLGVVGFRFDLMKALGRAESSAAYRVDHPLFNDLLSATGRHSGIDINGHEEALMHGVFLSGEPWDIEGWPVGLPKGIAEWRAETRNRMHDAWRTFDGVPGKVIATELAGVGYLKTAMTHDSFTAIDAVSYAEGTPTNKEGGSHEHTVNCGVQGKTQNDAIIEERVRRVKYGLALDALAQGAVLRKLGGWHSQGGHNNPYDREKITRVPWGSALKPYQKELVDFEGVCGTFKNHHASLRRGDLNKIIGLTNPDYPVLHSHGDKDITWVNAQGYEMQGDWPNDHAFGFVLNGETGRKDDKGNALRDLPILALLNGSSMEVEMEIPHSEIATCWKVAFNSCPEASKTVREGQKFTSGRIKMKPFTALVFESDLPLHVSQATKHSVNLEGSRWDGRISQSSHTRVQ